MSTPYEVLDSSAYLYQYRGENILYVPFFATMHINTNLADIITRSSDSADIYEALIKADKLTKSVIDKIEKRPSWTKGTLEAFRNYAMIHNYGIDKHSPTLVVIPTYSCNLKCKYCYSNAQKNCKPLIFDDLIKILQLIENKWNNARAKVVFNGGGEPTLNMGVIRKTVEYIKSKENARVGLGITSNGMFSLDVCDWLSHNSFNVSLSIDGAESVERRHGRWLEDGSRAERLKRNILRLKNNGTPVSVITTVSSYSVSHMADTMEYLKELGVSSVTFNPINNSGRARESDLLKPSSVDFIQGFADSFEFGMRNNISVDASDCLASFDKLIFMHCKAENGTILSISPGGLIHTCMEAASEKHPYASLFSVDRNDLNKSGFNWNPKLQGLRNPHQIIDCENCFILPQCGGGCLMRVLEKDDDSMEFAKSPNCEISKGVAMHQLWSLAKNRGVNNDYISSDSTPSVLKLYRFTNAERAFEIMMQLAEVEFDILS